MVADEPSGPKRGRAKNGSFGPSAAFFRLMMAEIGHNFRSSENSAIYFRLYILGLLIFGLLLYNPKNDLKSVFWFKSYTIFSDKIGHKTLRGGFRKKKLNIWGIFISIILPSQDRKCEKKAKKDFKNAQNDLPSSREQPEGDSMTKG